MSVNTIIKEIYNYYFLPGPKWLVFTYIMSVIAAIIIGLYGKRKNKGVRWIGCMILLFFYSLTVITSTVLSRATATTMRINVDWFWSWRKVFSGSKSEILAVVGNIILLGPIGFLLPTVNEKRYSMASTVLIGCFFSVLIELSQLLLRRGLFELDDVINNTIGVVIGYVAFTFVHRCIEQIKGMWNWLLKG